MIFSKLKEKLKKSISLFSKKAEEESEPQSVPESDKATPIAAVRQDAKKIQAKKPEPSDKQVKETPQAGKKGIFSKSLLTTRKLSGEKFDELFWDIELVLLENNVAVDVIGKIKENLRSELVDKSLPRDLGKAVSGSLKATVKEILSLEKINVMQLASAKKPFVIAFFGVNGSGKTTTIAKIAALLKKQGFTSVLAAGDTFRAAAIHQLEEHAINLGLKLIKHDYGADPAAVAYDALQYARKNGVDVVLVDTAGRLHSDTNLMGELKKIVRVANPDLKIFVGESITGNDCVEQAQKFDSEIGIDGSILTKADVDEKGGTALSISFTIKKPILYIGTGQDYDALSPFSEELVISNLGLNSI